MAVTVRRMKMRKINRPPNNRSGMREIYCTLPQKQLTSAGSKVQGGVRWVGRWVGWQADLWSGGGDCGANGFQEGGRTGVWALQCTSVRLMTLQNDQSGQSTCLHKPPLSQCCSQLTLKTQMFQIHTFRGSMDFCPQTSPPCLEPKQKNQNQKMYCHYAYT